ncbi:MAG: (2Fe-2S)-binding protein [Candidatus Nanopelagicales bacterium]
MILCHCAVVSHDDIDDAVAEGACSLREVLVRTRAGRDCGGCIPLVRERAEAALRQAGRSRTAPHSEVVHAAG